LLIFNKCFIPAWPNTIILLSVLSKTYHPHVLYPALYHMTSPRFCMLASVLINTYDKLKYWQSISTKPHLLKQALLYWLSYAVHCYCKHTLYDTYSRPICSSSTHAENCRL